MAIDLGDLPEGKTTGLTPEGVISGNTIIDTAGIRADMANVGIVNANTANVTIVKANNSLGSNGMVLAANSTGGTYWSLLSSLANTAELVSTANGYIKLQQGLIVQWGWVRSNTSIGNVTFPIAFPTSCIWTSACVVNTATEGSIAVTVGTTTTMNVRTSSDTATNTHWIAIGI